MVLKIFGKVCAVVLKMLIYGAVFLMKMSLAVVKLCMVLFLAVAEVVLAVTRFGLAG